MSFWIQNEGIREASAYVSFHGFGAREEPFHQDKDNLGGHRLELVDDLGQTQAETLAGTFVGRSKTADQPLHRVVKFGGGLGVKLGILLKLSGIFSDDGLAFLYCAGGERKKESR